MERGWQKHPVFPNEPFTAREAWEWLIAEAYWREGRMRAGKFVATLQRGQLCASVRYLADCWQWEKSKAERFLKRLKTETMIETRILKAFVGTAFFIGITPGAIHDL